MPLSAQQLAAQKNLSMFWLKAGAADIKGDYAPGTILPGEIELGEQYGVKSNGSSRSSENVDG